MRNHFCGFLFAFMGSYKETFCEIKGTVRR